MIHGENHLNSQSPETGLVEEIMHLHKAEWELHKEINYLKGQITAYRIAIMGMLVFFAAFMLTIVRG